MGVSKVEFGGTTLLDLTNDTVAANTLSEGVTAHGANGDLITGTLNMGNYYTKAETEQLIEEAQPNLEEYAKKNELPNISGLASTQYVDKEIEEVVAIAEGKCHTEVFDTVEALDTWLGVAANVATLNRGDIFLIRALNVPDYWWDGSTRQILETSKVDLSGYALKEHPHTAAQVSGLATVATSGSYNDLINKPTILTAASNGYSGAITTGGDGVAEMGKYIDFHNTADSTTDYSTRLTCTGDYENTVNLPSGTGTLTIGDKAYKIVTSSTAPTTTDTSIITIVI